MNRFYIRDLLWLVLLSAVALGWWLEHRSLALKARESELWRGRAEGMRDAWVKKGGDAVWLSDESPTILFLDP